jgi:hypothetical protein
VAGEIVRMAVGIVHEDWTCPLGVEG